MDKDIKRIIECEAGAEDLHWEAAELIAKKLSEGMSQRQLAREIGKSQSHVGRMSQVWNKYRGDPPEGRDFNACYQEFAYKADRKPERDAYDSHGRGGSAEDSEDEWGGDEEESDEEDWSPEEHDGDMSDEDWRDMVYTIINSVNSALARMEHYKVIWARLGKDQNAIRKLRKQRDRINELLHKAGVE